MKVLIVDDHMIVREGLKLILESARPDFDVQEAANGSEALIQLQNDGPFGLVLLDIKMPKTDGLTVMQEISKHYAEVPVIVLTTFDSDEVVQEMVQLGAKSFLLKNTDSKKILSTIDQVLAGNLVLSTEMASKAFNAKKQSLPAIELSDREQKVLQLLIDGYRNKEIAESLYVSERTVKNVLTQIYNKLGVSSRSEAVAYAFKHDLLNR
ncbi:response regulator transcription factor [Fructobacillus sp. W13]|uniref:Response regulator transcription factor n=1 Tax=Fructobacillus apis TaxID=2935017 RepID=A0ABT0ZQU7_9LACO|nr:response regulator transcription factor [Fructobacillus apis]MCO0832352.1 response regulator transcription factor [Fructobacillus apis]